MIAASYYRLQAAHAHRLARTMHQTDVVDQLEQMARDCDAMADRLEHGIAYSPQPLGERSTMQSWIGG